MAFSFLVYLFSFWRYLRFCIISDDVIVGSTKTAQHSIENNSRNIKVVILKLGTSNVHHKRNRMTAEEEFGIRGKKTNVMLNLSLAVLGVAAKLQFPTALCHEKLFTRFTNQELVLQMNKCSSMIGQLLLTFRRNYSTCFYMS